MSVLSLEIHEELADFISKKRITIIFTAKVITGACLWK